jgi:hypothetical protein
MRRRAFPVLRLLGLLLMMTSCYHYGIRKRFIMRHIAVVVVVMEIEAGGGYAARAVHCTVVPVNCCCVNSVVRSSSSGKSSGECYGSGSGRSVYKVSAIKIGCASGCGCMTVVAASAAAERFRPRQASALHSR